MSLHLQFLLVTLALFLRSTDSWIPREIVFKSQKLCLQLTRSPLEHQDILQGVLCGDNHLSPQKKSLFQKSHLIHLLVVSGSHLLFLDQLLKMMALPVWIRVSAFLLLTLATGAAAPCLRSLFFLLLNLAPNARHPNPTDLTCLLSGLLCLLIEPNWWKSLSLVLSWLAALALSLGFLWRDSSPAWRHIGAHTAVYVFLLLPMAALGTPHPLGIIWNLTLGVLLNWVLLPLSLLTAILPFLRIPYDVFISTLLNILDLFGDPLSLTAFSPLNNPPHTSYQLLWAYIFFIHLVLALLRTRTLQRRLVINNDAY